jgi:superfamily II DNA or RNA helicase
VSRLTGETALNTTVRKSLRPYQARLLADVCRANGPVLVEQPTGSGKTMQIVTLVAMQLGQCFTHAVIAVPPKMYNALA